MSADEIRKCLMDWHAHNYYDITFDADLEHVIEELAKLKIPNPFALMVLIDGILSH